MTTVEPTRRTPEQDETVRRRSLILSLCGFFCGALALVLLLGRTSDSPPNVFAVNLSFCAMMIGIGIVFYIKGTSRVSLARVASISAIVTGMAGSMLFMSHGLKFRQARETRELGNAEKIVKSATRYAREHATEFPSSLSILLENRYLSLEDLRSPYGTLQKPADAQRLDAQLAILQTIRQVPNLSRVDRAILVGPLQVHFGKDIEEKSDYQYFGAGLALPGKQTNAALPEEIILATSRFAISGSQMTVAFADGSAVFLDLANAESALIASNAARTANGFPAIRPPDVIQRAQQYKQAPSSPRN